LSIGNLEEIFEISQQNGVYLQSGRATSSHVKFVFSDNEWNTKAIQSSVRQAV